MLIVIGERVQADWVITNEMTTDVPGVDSSIIQMVTKIKGLKQRIDTDSISSVIYDAETRQTITLMHDTKQFMIQTASQMKERNDQMRFGSQFGNGAKTQITDYVATGNEETINGYLCKEYRGKTPFGTIIQWMTDKLPNSESIKQATKKIYSNYPGPSLLQTDVTEPGGFAIRTTTISEFNLKPYADKIQKNGNLANTTPTVYRNTTTSTFVSAKTVEVPLSAFEIPEDYTEFGKPTKNTNTVGSQEELFQQMRARAKSSDERAKAEKLIKQFRDSQNKK